MSSMKKNILAVALVAGLGMAGAAAAYNYGTLKDANAPGLGNENSPAVIADMPVAEPVAYQNIYISTGYKYTMREQLIWDFNPPDNAINFTNGFTARMMLMDGASFDTSYTPVAFNVDASTCTLQDHDGNPATAPILMPPVATVRTTEDIYLDRTLMCTWDVNFDNYYPATSPAYSDQNVISIRITPKQGVTNPQNPSSGLLLRYDNAHLTSLDEFANGPMGNIVHGDFWFINPTNDAPFTDSRMVKDVLMKVSGVYACTDIDGADVDKYIDVSDSWLSDDMPKSRFSWDGKLGSTISSSDNFSNDPRNGDFDRQWINLGDVTINPNDVAGGGFVFLPTDEFTVVLQGDTGGWLAFDNGTPAKYDDDIWLYDGNCVSGTPLLRGHIDGTRVDFNRFNAANISMPMPPPVGVNQAVNLTVCAFVDSDTVINDQNIAVTTTFFRNDIVGGSQVFPAVGGDACNLLPLRYNGSTMEIYTINPASNTTQRSFIRLTNRSATDGFVSLEGVTDTGDNGASQVRVWVPAGASVQLNSADLENGTNGAVGGWGAMPDFGDGRAHKWRAVVTAEFPGLVATSLVNSTGGAVLANLTDSDTRGEQYMRDGIEGTIASLPGFRPSDLPQESTPDFRGNGQSTGIPGGPNGSDGPAGGTTGPCGNEGNGSGQDHGTSADTNDHSNEDPYCY